MKRIVKMCLLVLCMLYICLLPLRVEAAEIVDSGTCGDNLTWTLDSAGTLTISGEGKMANYFSGAAPWYAKQTSITNVVLENGMTSIGRSAFYGCRSLTSVTIPESVTSIGRSAFYGCRSLTSVTIPEGVTSIGSGAFACGDSLTSLTVAEGNPVYYSAGDCLIETTTKTLLQGCSTSVIPTDGSVTSIGGYSFHNCQDLISMTIPEGITSIGDGAFDSCMQLTSVTIPNTVTTIYTNAFYDCMSLETVYFNGTKKEWDSISVGYGNDHLVQCKHYMLRMCGEDLTWMLDSEGTLTISGTGDMTDYSSLSEERIPWHNVRESVKALIIESGVASIGDWAFSDCSSLTSVTIPESVTSIGSSAFSDCGSLTSVTIPKGVTSIGSRAFSGCSSLTSVTIPEGVTSIGYGAFYDCSSLTSVTIPKSVTSIGTSAFYVCSSLTSVTIPEGVTSIGDYVFYGCSSLASVTIPEGVTSIGDGAFRGCSSLTSVTIPESVTSIGDDAFCGCSSLTNATVPENVTSIGRSVFAWCSSLVSLTVSEENSVYHSDGNCIIETASKTLIAGHSTSVIPSDGSVISIGDGAFYGCKGLTNVTIPSGVTSIGNSAFDACTEMHSVTIPNSVTTIYGNAFYDCTDLWTVYFNGTQEEWDSITIYYGNEQMTGARLHLDICSGTCGENLTWTLGDEGILIISGTGDMRDYLPGDSPWYYECKPVKTLVIEGGVTSIGVWAFYGCSSLNSVTIPENVASIGKGAFYGCSSLNSVTIPEGVTSIDDWTFSGCSSLTSVTIPEGVTSIGNWAFQECINLKDVYFSGTLQEWNEIDVDEGNGWLIGATLHLSAMVEPEVNRIAGSGRWDTAIQVADELKATLGVEKFSSIIVASGNDFADALAGSYLSTQKRAPILLSWGKGGKYASLDTDNINYIRNNLTAGGTVYILGGTSAVPSSYETDLSGIKVVRLAGGNRYETNLAILKEAGVADGSEILVCTGVTFADSLSAAATGKPILLVQEYNGKVYGIDAAFLNGHNYTFTIIGGAKAVGDNLKEELGRYGEVTRLSGDNRMDTSVKVAERYFTNPDSAVVAYAWNYPDGLCGGALAYAMHAPLILTMEKWESAAVAYVDENNITTGYVLGGAGLVSDSIVREIFGMAEDAKIPLK